MRSKLPGDATLRDMRSSPKDIQVFARRVLAVMHAARKDHGDIVIRMGITGTGMAPNYRIEHITGRLIAAIDGANHRSWPEGSAFDGDEAWSRVTMSYQDVQNVIATVAH